MASDRIHTETSGDELPSLVIEGMIEGTLPRERPRTKYNSQIIKDAGFTTHVELKYKP